MMKNSLTIIAIFIFTSVLEAQVYTSEVKVEQISGDFTGIGTESPTTKLHIQTNAPEDQNEIKIGRFDNMDPLGRSGNYPSIYADFVLRIPQRVQIFGGGNGKQYLDIRDQSGGQKIKLDAEGASFLNSGSFGIGTSSPSKLLHVRGNPEDENDRDILAYFEQSASTSEDAGIAIKGARNNSVGTVSFIDFDIYDNNETNTTFTMAKIGAGKQSTAGENGNLRFFTNDGSSLVEHMRIKANGNVGIKTDNPTYNLHVIGSIKGTTLHTDTQSWSDFVFENDYDLRTLEEVEEHIAEKGHLPEIPSEAEVIENGINLGEMDAKLLQKIEELTLYLIEQDKRNRAQQEQLETQSSLIEQLSKEVSALKKNK